MDWDQVVARWKQARGRVRQKWARLTEDDLKTIAGPREPLESKLHERDGFTTDQYAKKSTIWFVGNSRFLCALAITKADWLHIGFGSGPITAPIAGA